MFDVFDQKKDYRGVKVNFLTFSKSMENFLSFHISFDW